MTSIIDSNRLNRFDIARIGYGMAVVFVVLFASLVFGAEMNYPKAPLQNDPVEDGRSLYPGTPEAPLSDENVVSIDYVPGNDIVDPDSVYAGLARKGNCEKNKLIFKNGYVARFVLGGFSLQGAVRENSVVFSGGLAADAAIGKLCGGQTKDGDLENNRVTVSGGRIVGDVYGGDADADGSAIGNRVVVLGGELSGFVNGGGTSGIGVAKNNRVTLSGGTVGMGVSGGFAHFAAGSAPEAARGEDGTIKTAENTNSALENTVVISGKVEIEGNVSGGLILDSNGSANGNRVEISGGTIRGNIYGGRAFGGEANRNEILISGGTVKERDEVVYAGYVHKPANGRAVENTITLSGSPELETITFHGNNLSTWKTDGNRLIFKGFRGTIRGFSHFQEIEIDETSQVTVTGEGPHETVDLDNRGRLIFKNGKLIVHGKAGQ